MPNNQLMTFHLALCDHRKYQNNWFVFYLKISLKMLSFDLVHFFKCMTWQTVVVYVNYLQFAIVSGVMYLTDFFVMQDKVPILLDILLTKKEAAFF